MATSKDIAKIIASQHGIKPAEAENFIQQLVDTINEGIENDRLVKIKGFGTFKMQSIKPRSSVNVNTGERVVIGEHDRITFLPDASMKNTINKPFAHFETVEIADGSPLLDEMITEEESDDDIREDELEELKDEETPVVEEPVKVEPVKAEPVKEEKKVEEPLVKKEEPVKKEPAKKEEPVFVMAPKKPASVAKEEIEEPESISERMQGQGNVFVGIAAGILIVIAAIFGFNKYNSSKAPVAPAVQQTVVADTVQNDTIKKDTVVLGTETTQVADDDTTSVSDNKKKRRGRKYRRHRRRR
jgi:nucleoid DNA-binding protein